MEIDINIRHRTNHDDPIVDRHTRTMRNLARIVPPWGSPKLLTIPTPDCGAELGVEIFPNKLMKLPVKNMEIGYIFRSHRYGYESGSLDDRFVMTIEDQIIPYGDFVNHVFPQYITAFEAYFAVSQHDIELLADDHEEITNQVVDDGIDWDTRRNVYRIWPIMYFDRELCVSAFHRSPEEIIERWKPHVERVELLNDGVFLISTTELIPREAIIENDKKLKNLLV